MASVAEADGPVALAERRDTALAAYVEGRTGLLVEVHAPRRSPERWQAYLDGAETRYREHGTLPVLGRAELEDGGSASLVFVAVDHADRVVGGLRCHGPLPRVAAAAAVRELSTSPRIGAFRQQIEDRLPAGVVEVKGVWAVSGLTIPGLSDALARCYVHAMNWFDAGFALCTCSTRVASRWESTGGRPIAGFEPVPYPDERYGTIPLWWRRDDLVHLATPEQWESIVEESELLGVERDQLARRRAS
jgi:hypothetical protein